MLPGSWFSNMGDTLMRFGVQQYADEQKTAQLAADDAQQRAGLGAIFSNVGQLSANDQPSEFLKQIMQANPKLQERLALPFATALEARTKSLQDQRSADQYRMDMGNLLEQYQQLPAAQQPAFLATTAAQMGPQYAQQLFNYSHEQYQQQGTATQQAASLAAQTQAQQASATLQERRISAEQNLQNQRTAAAGAAAAATGAGGANLGPLPQGMQWEMGPGGVPRAIALPNTQEWLKAETTVAATNRAKERIAEMRAHIKDGGTAFLPGNRAGVLSNLYGSIIADMGLSRGMGVLQEGERRALESSFPDPTKAGALVPGSNAQILGALDQLDTEVNSHLVRNQRMFGAWPGINVTAPLPPGHRPYRPAGQRATPNPASILPPGRGGAAAGAGGTW